MAGNFDSAISALNFYEGTIASATATLTAGNAYVLPYDVEVVSAAIVGTPGLAAQYLWADVQRIPVGTTTASSLFSPPFGTANINTVKLDQSYVTVGVTASVVANTLNGALTNTTAAVVFSGTNFAAGQGVIIAGSGVTGNYITAVSGTALTLAKPVTVASGAAVVAVSSPTPAAGQSVQILGITDTFFKVLNNTTTGAPGQTVYSVVDFTESTTAPFQTFRVGPIKQAGLYDTTTGFWKFTTDKTTLSAGTWQLLEAPVLPGVASGQTNGTFNYPDVSAKLNAGDTVRVLWKPVDNKGVLRTTTATATNLTLSLAVKRA